MTSLGYLRAALAWGGAVLALTGCGGDEHPALDAATAGDAATGDAVADPCYRERADADNGATPESTGLALGVGPVAICGAIAIDHPGAGFLDVDQYAVAVTVNGPTVVRIMSPSAGELERVDLIVRSAGGQLAVARVHGGLGVAALSLTAGSYAIAVEAQGTAPAAVPYRIDIIDDDPALRCPIEILPQPDYREANESGVGHRANDVVAVRTMPTLVTSLTAATTDAPEPTQLAVSAGGRKTIAGTSADVVPVDDPYHDRDTFEVYAGQSTNLLEIRAIWPGALADLDVLVFEAGRADDPMGRPVPLLTGELLVTAVKPATRYWIWVGGSSRSSQLPASYGLAICGHELAVGF